MEVKEEKVLKSEITITADAAREIQKVREANQIPDSHALRIGVKSGGCCGISYLLAFDEKADETDSVFHTEGIKILVDQQSLTQLSGAILRFVEGPQGKGFKFDNPNAEGSCSCEEGCCD
jgi:iron-sulfur cluster assembly protein